MEVPVVADAVGNVTAPNNFLTEVIGLYEENQSRKEELNTRYATLVAEGKKTIALAENVKQLNKVLATLAEVEVIYDSRLVLAKALNARAKEIGAKYDKEKKAYVSDKAKVQDNAEPAE